MSFFVTSRPTGNGGDLGGLAGADAHCQTLANEAGSRKRQWRAYLSAAPEADHPAVHARDRIGHGPWFNAKGVEVAADVNALHSSGHKLGQATSLDERGRIVSGYIHDMLTGSNIDGTLPDGDTTCHNWTSTRGAAMVGHHNMQGGGDRPRSWNSAHLSEGCSTAAIRSLGGDARFYCFAAD